MKRLFFEFKEFALKGNMIDLAVAVVIGTAFGAVVNSLVKDIIMPIISLLIPGKGDYTAWQIGPIRVGAFLGEVLNFLVIALAVFIVIVKVMGYLMKRVAPAPPPADPVTKE